MNREKVNAEIMDKITNPYVSLEQQTHMNKMHNMWMQVMPIALKKFDVTKFTKVPTKMIDKNAIPTDPMLTAPCMDMFSTLSSSNYSLV